MWYFTGSQSKSLRWSITLEYLLNGQSAANEKIEDRCVIDPDISDLYFITFKRDVELPKLEKEKSLTED